VKTFADRKQFVLAAFAAMALALAAPGQAAAAESHGFGGHDGGGAVGHRGFEGHHFDGRHFEGHEFERRHFEGHGGFGFVVPYSAPYYAPYPTSSYWYYCPSYDAYYPDVSSCPETWVPVPAP
jgi:hypothetical protein